MRVLVASSIFAVYSRTSFDRSGNTATVFTSFSEGDLIIDSPSKAAGRSQKACEQKSMIGQISEK